GAVGEPEGARKLAVWMDETLLTAARRAAGAKTLPRTLYYSGGYTAGSRTVFDELLRAAGGVNAAAAAGLVGYAQLSTELAVSLDPDVVILPGSRDVTGDGTPGGLYDPKSVVVDDPAWRSTKAVRTGRVYVLPAERLTAISHFVVLGACDLAAVLHPTATKAEPIAPRGGKK
ncbi:MAG: ABC transporter substrate-binding protein, partial [Planctomycetia bacterium]